ncbi:hypothetical protein PHMEG_00035681, partial [Phytophthora megakarya]
MSESELLAWGIVVRHAFMPPEETKASAHETDQTTSLLEQLKRQSVQIDVLILQNTSLPPEMLLSVSSLPPGTPPQPVLLATRLKKKGSQLLAAAWFQWYTAEPRVIASPAIKKTKLYELRHTVRYMILFLPLGFALDPSTPAYKDELLALGEKAQGNALHFLKAHGSSALALGTALKALR